MPKVLFFAQARDATGCREAEIEGDTLEAVLANAVVRYGSPFKEVLSTSAVWVNGEPPTDGVALGASDEVAVLPPVSGG